MAEEQPGKILHEVRRRVELSRASGDEDVHYGSADAPPSLVMLVGRALWLGAPVGGARGA